MRNESARILAAMNAKARRLIDLKRPMVLEWLRVETNDEWTNGEVAAIVQFKKGIRMRPSSASASAVDSLGPAIDHYAMR